MKKLFAVIFSACILASGFLAAPAYAREAAPLDQASKEILYEEYQTIAEQVADETGRDISLLPMEEFAPEDWQTPEDFRALLTEIANWKLTGSFLAPEQPRSTSAERTATLEADGQEYKLTITGSFETAYNETSRRQHFSGFPSIESELSGSSVAWTQTGCEVYSLDDNRTYAVNVWGKLTISGAVFENQPAHAEFHCTANGAVY